VGVAGSIRGQMPVGPSAASRQFLDRQASANVAHTSDNLHFFSRGQQTPAQAGRPAGQGTAIRPAGAAQAQSGFRRFGEPGVSGAAQNARPAQTTGGNQPPAARTDGIRRFGEPGSTQPAAQRPSTNQTQRTNGWNSFGTPGSSTPSRQPYNPPSQNSRPDQGQTQTSGSSAPRQQQSTPSYSAPRSAPASNGSSNGSSHPASSGSGGGHTSSSSGSRSGGGGRR